MKALYTTVDSWQYGVVNLGVFSVLQVGSCYANLNTKRFGECTLIFKQVVPDN